MENIGVRWKISECQRSNALEIPFKQKLMHIWICILISIISNKLYKNLLGLIIITDSWKRSRKCQKKMAWKVRKGLPWMLYLPSVLHRKFSFQHLTTISKA